VVIGFSTLKIDYMWFFVPDLTFSCYFYYSLFYFVTKPSSILLVVPISPVIFELSEAVVISFHFKSSYHYYFFCPNFLYFFFHIIFQPPFLIDFFLKNNPVIPVGMRAKSAKDSAPVEGVVVIFVAG